MEKLYLDNYRGFTDQYIEICDVNFLVGENSTGKSSVLFALKTIFSEKFWSALDFSVSEGQGYSFDDLVSAAKTNKSYFRLGYIFENENKTSFLFEFVNDGGKPSLSKAVLSQCDNTIYINIAENKKTITYKNSNKKTLTFDEFESCHAWNELKNVKQDISPIVLVNIIASNNPVFVFDSRQQSIDFTAPIRSKPRKTYDEPATHVSSEGGHIPYLLRRLFNENGASLRTSLNNFGKQSGLFNDIEIKDYGSGIDDVLFRLNFLLDKIPINIVNLGYGVSQVFPVLFNIFTGKDDVFEIQQPEVYLHPKAQAALGDVFFDITIEKQEKKFYIETHSDYLIDRFRQRQKKAAKKASAQVLFFSRTNGLNKAQSIGIDQSGNYPNEQPPEFRDFFLTEAMENLGL
ncbi:hypothetical protein FACS1894190_00900 [Spirochaetia bacterium]|nr:hypothetical protein FACS1894190_00900 [Spirochaetia bacterium]